MSVLLSAPVLRDLAYEKVKETLSVIPEEVVDKVGLENLGVQESSVQVGLRAKTYSHTLHGRRPYSHMAFKSSLWPVMSP